MTQESNEEEVTCSGNISYGRVLMTNNGLESKEDGTQDEYDYL